MNTEGMLSLEKAADGCLLSPNVFIQRSFKEEEVIFIASAKGRYGHKRTPTPLHNTHEKRK